MDAAPPGPPEGSIAVPTSEAIAVRRAEIGDGGGVDDELLFPGQVGAPRQPASSGIGTHDVGTGIGGSMGAPVFDCELGTADANAATSRQAVYQLTSRFREVGGDAGL